MRTVQSAFIATLATMTSFTGLALLVSTLFNKILQARSGNMVRLESRFRAAVARVKENLPRARFVLRRRSPTPSSPPALAAPPVAYDSPF